LLLTVPTLSQASNFVIYVLEEDWEVQNEIPNNPVEIYFQQCKALVLIAPRGSLILDTGEYIPLNKRLVGVKDGQVVWNSLTNRVSETHRDV
jgi:hypothetical protein